MLFAQPCALGASKSKNLAGPSIEIHFGFSLSQIDSKGRLHYSQQQNIDLGLT